MIDGGGWEGCRIGVDGLDEVDGLDGVDRVNMEWMKEFNKIEMFIILQAF